MGFLKGLIQKVREFFVGGKAEQLGARLLRLAAVALPVATELADIAVKLTATTVDDAIWQAVKQRFPRIFQARGMGERALKDAMRATVVDELRRKFPSEPDSMLNTGTELAVVAMKNGAG